MNAHLQKKKLSGNERFEGFAIDLMSAIANELSFNVTFQLVKDGQYGKLTDQGVWNGMMKEVRGH